MLPHGLEVEPVGNAALRGTRMLLLARNRPDRIAGILSITRHVELAADPAFQDIYAESMSLEPFYSR